MKSLSSDVSKTNSSLTDELGLEAITLLTIDSFETPSKAKEFPFSVFGFSFVLLVAIHKW